MLEKKRVLFIAPSFFGYEHDIRKELNNLGAEVDYFDERPFTSSFLKILNRLNFKVMLKKRIERYYDEILSMCKDRCYDYLFVISPETLSVKFLNDVAATNPKMKRILYMWDSFENKPNARFVMSEFNSVFSFDPDACSDTSNIEFLPLFYSEKFAVSGIGELVKNDYAVCFIGTVHSDRVKLVKELTSQFSKQGFETFEFYYCPSKMLFLLKKVFTSEMKYLTFKEVSFKPMTKEQMIDVLKKSSAVIDIQHPGQVGLTMRTFELLGLGKKIITTNSDIVNYDFYDSSNVEVVCRDKPLIRNAFMESEYKHVSTDKYSLESWLKTIFMIG